MHALHIVGESTNLGHHHLSVKKCIFHVKNPLCSYIFWCKNNGDLFFGFEPLISLTDS